MLAFPTFLKSYKWLFLLVSIIILHNWWSYSGRKSIKKHTPLNIKEISEVGVADAKTNIVCIQPYMQLQDYASLELFYDKIDKYFAAVKEEGLLHKNTIIVFPEHIGTPLILVDEKASTIEAKTINEALLFAATSNIWKIGIEWIDQPQSNLPTLLFKFKTEKMGEIFNFVFASMAKKYQTYVIPGTILLGSPVVKKGKLTSNGSSFYNASVVYHPEGKALPLVMHETHLSTIEKIVAKPNDSKQRKTFVTPVGKIMLLIGDDIWQKNKLMETYQDIDVVINPLHSAVTLQDNSKTYFNTLAIPETFHPNVSIPMAENLKHVLGGKRHVALSVFLRGNFMEYPLYGKTYIHYKQEVITGFEVQGASIISLGIN